MDINEIEQYKQTVRANTLKVKEIYQYDLHLFSQLSEDIEKGKVNLNVNSVEFMVAKVPSKYFPSINPAPIDLSRRGYFNLIVLGEFKRTFEPTVKVAKALSDFYLEYNILPRLVPIPRSSVYRELDKLAEIVRNGILLYERR